MRRHARYTLAIVVLTALAAAVSGSPRTLADESYTFTVDGEPYDPWVISLDGEPEQPRPGDLISIDRVFLTLGERRECHFVTTPEEDGRLLLRNADGSQRVIAATVNYEYGDLEDDYALVIYNPLAKLSAEEIRGLWGVRLNQWPQGIEGKLQHIDPLRTCVTVNHNTAQGEQAKFPPVPTSIRYLFVDENMNRGIEDYSPLARLSALRFLRLDTVGRAAVDLRWIAGNRELKHLNLSGDSVKNLPALEALTELRYLDFDFCEGVDDVSFVAAMGRLKRLSLEETQVKDLSPLSGLEELIEFNAAITPAEKLPDGPMPALRLATIFSTSVSDERAAAFAASHPQCDVRHRWGAAFRRAAAPTTRIRVRSGGTCCRDRSREKTLFEITDPKKIRELLANIGIDESESGFECECCGGPSFEFYRDKELIATLGFHHGRSLRWPDVWYGDGMLTNQSADYLVRWLAENGVTGPLEEREHARKQELATRRRNQQLQELLPAKVLAALREAKSQEATFAAFEKGVEDPTLRILLYFRLIGPQYDSWNLRFGPDGLVADGLLPRVDRPTLSAAIRKAAADPTAVHGAARWIFEMRQDESIDADTLAAVLPALARNGLSHPRQINRRKTIAGLQRIKTTEAVELLRECLAGKIEVRELPEEEEVEPGGNVVYQGDEGDVHTDCSDAACAAMVLSKLGDRPSLPTIRDLAAKATGEDRPVLDKAVRRLQKTGGRGRP